MSAPVLSEEPLDRAGGTDGAVRVHLRFEPEGAEVRVPSGTPVFDAASWNGIAIDSTCGGHGTCKKCKVRVLEGEVPISPVDPRAFSPDELRDGWRLACRAPAREDLVVEVPPLQTRPKAALVGRRPSRDPAPGGAEAPPGARGADARGPALGRRARAGRARRPGAEGRPGRGEDAGQDPARVVLRRHRRGLRRRADRDRAGRHHRPALRDRVRPRHHDGRGHAARPRDRPAGGGRLDAQPPAALRRRRDLARLGDDARRRRARRAGGARARDAVPARLGGLRGGRRPGRGGLRDRRLRQRDDDPDRARHRPRAALDGALHRRRARASARGGERLRRHRAPARAGGRVPLDRRLRGRRHRGGAARLRAHARQAPAAVHRRRDQQRDRARQPRPRAGDRRAGRPGVRGGADPLRDARRRGRDRGREDRRTARSRSR